MRILAISSWWPEPANNGSRMRIANLLRSLAQHHDIHLIALTQEPITPEQIAAVRQYCANVEAIPQLTYMPRRSDLLASLISPEPASVRQTYNPAVAQAVRWMARQIQPDVVLALQISTAPYATLVDAPRILEELEVGLLLHQFRSQQHPIHRMRAWFTWRKHQSYVASVLRHFDAGTVASAHELAAIKQIAPAGIKLRVIPNGADVAGCFDIQAPIEADTLIYPGALSFDANLDAMTYFLAEIFPLIRAKHPATRLRITGKNTPEQRAALPVIEGVEFTGYVADVRPLIASSTLEVVPLRKGGGTRLKILEALALGTPVVSTSKGAEGLELQPGQDLLIADTPAAFAEATLQVLRDRQLRQQLGTAGRSAVQQHYDWRSIATNLSELITETVATRRGGYVYSAA